ncbi:MAG: hypothetical protein ACREKH_07770 [Candidatus Rokuibacteriota bacterium]
MRKTVLFALVFCALAGAANAQIHRPTFNRQYNCDYSAPWTNERDPGWSIFTDERYFPGPKIIYGIEVYQTPSSQDNRKIAFAKWEDLCPIGDPDCLENEPNRTRYEFTIKDGVQCTNTVVREFGRTINFTGCSNGKNRFCTRQ